MSDQAEKGEWPSDALPQTWAWTPFSEAWSDCTDSTKKLKQKEYLDEGPLTVVDQGEGLIGGYTDRVELKNDVKLPCVVFGDHTRAVKFIDFEFAQGADGVKVLQPNDQYDPEFAYQAIRCVRLPNKGYSRHFKFLKSTAFPIPPLPEQRRIVAKLDRLSARSAAARDHLARTTKLATRAKQAILSKAFNGVLTGHSEFGVEPPKDEYYWPIPDGWSWQQVKEVGDVSLGRQRSPKNHSGPDMRPYIRAANITWRGIDTSDVLEMNFDATDFERFQLEAGDVLLNEGSGSAKEVGKPAIWRGEIEDCCFQNTVLRVKPKLCSSEYLYWYFYATALAEGFVSNTQGINIQHIGKKGLAEFFIPHPPEDEQAEIVRRIEAAFARIDRMTEEASRAAHLLDRLDERLMAKAFCGELVPQDPEDEPAEALLTRIRQSRATAPKAKRGRKKAQA